MPFTVVNLWTTHAPVWLLCKIRSFTKLQKANLLFSASNYHMVNFRVFIFVPYGIVSWDSIKWGSCPWEPGHENVISTRKHVCVFHIVLCQNPQGQNIPGKLGQYHWCSWYRQVLSRYIGYLGPSPSIRKCCNYLRHLSVGKMIEGAWYQIYIRVSW